MKLGTDNPINLESNRYVAEVLVELYNTDEPRSTSDLKKDLNYDSTYEPGRAIDLLAENGMVTVTRERGVHNHIPPKVGEITDDGRDAVEKHDLPNYIKQTEDALPKRVQRLENRVEELEAVLEAIRDETQDEAETWGWDDDELQFSE